MKRTLTVLAMVLALAMSSMAAMSMGKGPHDKATGSLEWIAQAGTGPMVYTTFDAHDGAPGAQPDRGTVVTTVRDSTVTIALTCVDVFGDEARMSGTAVEVVGNRWDVGDQFVVWVKDNATPSSSSGAKVYDIGQTQSTEDCYSSNFTGTGSAVDGNLTVFSSPE